MSETATLEVSEQGHLLADLPDDAHPFKGKTPCSAESEDGVWLCNRSDGHPLDDRYGHLAVGQWFFNNDMTEPVEIAHYGWTS